MRESPASLLVTFFEVFLGFLNALNDFLLYRGSNRPHFLVDFSPVFHTTSPQPKHEILLELLVLMSHGEPFNELDNMDVGLEREIKQRPFRLYCMSPVLVFVSLPAGDS